MAGKASTTLPPTMSVGPLFVTTIVYVSLVPGTTVVLPSVLVTAMSARLVIVSVSVAELLFGFESVVPSGATTVTVFEIVPVA